MSYKISNEETPRWYEAKNGMYLESPRNTEFSEAIKIAVPGNCRWWNSEKRMWWISDMYLDEVDNLVFRHFEKTTQGRDI